LRIYNNANRIEKTLTKNVEKIVAGGQKKISFEYSLHRYAPFKNELTVDYRDAVEEGNEENNSDQFFYRTPRLPDLVVCARTPQQVNILKPSPIIFTVKNIGAVTAPAARLEMNIENRYPKNFDIGPLEPGQSITKQYASTWYRKGTRKFDITIDYRNKIQEYSENNTFYGKIIKISVHSTPMHGNEKCSGYLNNATEGR
jgi:subtilase family serine protease